MGPNGREGANRAVGWGCGLGLGLGLWAVGCGLGLWAGLVVGLICSLNIYTRSPTASLKKAD